MNKTCISCKTVKPIDQFHFGRGMRDGRLNKCKACCYAYSKARRAAYPGGPSEERRARYARELETGARTRKAPRGPIRGRDSEARRRSSLKYTHKRIARAANMTEFDQFAMDEAMRLRQLREKVTGGKWSLDHRIPLHHKEASGLHVGINFQVVPAAWNYAKRNSSMADFWPLGY